uniref:RmlD-like substrate binding domain-containing protein n=1 Tax=viral metagenome TaxID=1070528 RepID=A0A6C0DNX8_9ZZZZ
MILICGASGLVGKEMCKLLDHCNIDYIGTYNSNSIDKPNMFKIDFFNPVALEEFLIYHKITSCVFCIVERITDICEKDWNKIKTTNIDIVHIASYLCNKLNIKFIHLSTDYVFDGSNQPNYPDSSKNPLQNYGISKLTSEYRVLSNCINSCIIRTPVLYSTLSKIHDNAVCLIGKNVMDLRKDIKYTEDNYSIRRPLFIPDLCNFVLEVIFNDNKGIFHFYNPYNKFTKYEICQIIGKYLDINTTNIIPNNTKSEGLAPRPYDTQLKDDKLDILKYSFKNFDYSIQLCFDKFKHSNICIENKHDFFIMLDLDGTLIDSNLAHYNAYKKVFNKYDYSFLSIDEWNNIILNDNFDNYLHHFSFETPKVSGVLSDNGDTFSALEMRKGVKTLFDENMFNIIKLEKLDLMKYEEISFTKNSELFLRFLIENKFNFCIVTNTKKETVNIFKEKLSILNDIKQWIYRDDYNLPKPDSECYNIAKQKYYNNEKYIIGIEDSMVGYNALKPNTDIIYIYNNTTIFKNNDCYLFNDYNNIFTL